MKQPIFETKADMLEYLCACITPDPTNPNRFHIISVNEKASKKKKVQAWNNTLTLFGHDLIKMFLDEYGYIPSPDEIKSATLPRLSVVMGEEGVYWEIGIFYTKPRLLAFTPVADYEATVLKVEDEDREIIISAIVNMEDNIR